MTISPEPVSHIHLDFPVRPAPRYGWGRPPHQAISAILDRGREAYRRRLEGFLGERMGLLQIPRLPPAGDSNCPAWINGSLPGLDAVALYGFLACLDPSRYFEIGVGNSTKIARRAIRDHGLKTRITAIDPYPMPGIEGICDRLIVEPLECVDLTLFDQLGPGDILFVDNSHRVLMNSDATVVFLDILPRLKPGVIVEIHDIALPFDYPPAWVDRFYSEQYVLAAYLLADGRRFDVLLPNAFISLDPDLNRILDPLWLDPEMNAGIRFDPGARFTAGAADAVETSGLIETHGSSFWIRING